MTKEFGATTHAEIAHAFEAERRQHTYVEQLATGEHTKKYELRLTLDELFTVLDQLAGRHPESDPRLSMSFSSPSPGHQARQLRAKILATLGLFEDG